MHDDQPRFYEFGPFRLDTAERQLWHVDSEVPLTPKAFAVLFMLVGSNGRLVEKEVFMREVWADSFVEEKNLTDNISILRQVLGDDAKAPLYIKTVPRRGYRFVAQVSPVREDAVELLVAERTRTHVIIEEETSNEIVPVARPQAEPAMLIQSPAGWFKRRKAVLLLGTLGLVLLGGAATAFWKGWLKRSQDASDHHGLAPGREMKITRETNSGKVGAATISPDGKFIAYVENYSSGKGTLYVRQTGTNNEIQLLEPGERVFGGTAFSPDGAFIYYVSYEKTDPNGSLYRIPVLGGPTTRLIGNFDSMFTLSPDGRQVTFYRNDAKREHQSIMIATLDTGEERTLLSRAVSETVLEGVPAWSPDGSLIAFASAETRQAAEPEGGLSLFAADVVGAGLRQLSSERYINVGKMNWTPDGKGLVFVARRPRETNQLYRLSYPDSVVRRITNDLFIYGNYGLGITADQSAMVVDIWEITAQLWIVDAEGDASNARQLTLGGRDGVAGISSLADGRIAYVARTGDEYDIWTVKQDGTEAKPLTADPFSQGKMSATPDGRHLVFTSDRARGSHLFRMDTDGSNLKQLTFGDSNDSAPDCSPDSKWVAYEATSGGKTTVWKVLLEGGPPLRLTDYESVAPSFSPDGQMVSCVLPAASQIKQATIAIVSAAGGLPLKTFEVLTFAFSYNGVRWTPDGKALLFPRTEKNVINLWKQPLNGGAPQALTNFKSDSIYDYSYTRDGKSIILARGKVVVNVALITNFR